MANSNPSPATRFQPGRSGNPGGRPKGALSLTRLLRRKLRQKDAGGVRAAEEVVDALIAKAREGDARCIREILDRVDGRVVERQEIVDATPDRTDVFLAAVHRVYGDRSAAGQNGPQAQLSNFDSVDSHED